MHNYYSNNIIKNPNKKESKKQIPYNTPHLLSGLMSFAQSSWDHTPTKEEGPISPFEKWLQEFLSNSPGEFIKDKDTYIINLKSKDEDGIVRKKIIVQLLDHKVRIHSYKTYDYMLGNTEAEFQGELSEHEAKSILESLLN